METGIQESKIETAKSPKGNEYRVYRTPNPVLSGSGFSIDALQSRTTMIADAVDREIIDKQMGDFLKSYLAPKGHASHMKLKDCAESYFPGESVNQVRTKATTACMKIIQDLWYGENYENLRREKAADENHQAKKMRSPEEIAKAQAIIEAEKAARKKLGIHLTTPFLALTEEEQQALMLELRKPKED